MRVLRKTFLSTALIFMSITSSSSVNAQRNVDWNCVNFYKEQTITLRSRRREVGGWTYLIEDPYIKKRLRKQGFKIHSYIRGPWHDEGGYFWDAIYHTHSTLVIPKYTEEELMKKCRT